MGTAKAKKEEVEVVEFDDDCILDYDDIMEQDDLEFIDVVMDAFWKPKEGKKHSVVRLQVMNGIDRDGFEQLISSRMEIKNKTDFKIKSMTDIRVSLIQKCLVNSKGEKVFSHAKLKDLNKKNSAAIQFLFDKCQKLNKLSDDDVDEMAANLKNDLNGENGSNSLNG